MGNIYGGRGKADSTVESPFDHAKAQQDLRSMKAELGRREQKAKRKAGNAPRPFSNLV